MAQKLSYPAKPWKDGQRASLISGMDFMYSQSLRKWIPVTPGAVDANVLEEAFQVRNIQELAVKFDTVVEKQRTVDSEITLSGRIWKTENRPDNPARNDIWYDENLGRTYSYNQLSDTWVELNFIGTRRQQ